MIHRELPVCAKKNVFVLGTGYLRQNKKVCFFRQPICAKFICINILHSRFFFNNLFIQILGFFLKIIYLTIQFKILEFFCITKVICTEQTFIRKMRTLFFTVHYLEINSKFEPLVSQLLKCLYYEYLILLLLIIYRHHTLNPKIVLISCSVILRIFLLQLLISNKVSQLEFLLQYSIPQ